MSHLHRARIRHHIVPLIGSRRVVTLELPDGRQVRGHLATKTDTPPGTVLRWKNGGVGRIDVCGNLAMESKPSAEGVRSAPVVMVASCSTGLDGRTVRG